MVEVRSSEVVKEFDENVKQAREGSPFDFVTAERYAHRPEIKALRMSKAMLAKTTLEQVADKLIMPWDSEWLKVA